MANNDFLISIIVPIYGTEAYLPACIDSICRQTHHNIEIILVDDQSPDRCPKICDAYAEKDERIIVIHQENKGVSGARNAGLDIAKGDYIMFVDSDDELYPEAVEILLKDALDYGADIVSAIKNTVDSKGKTISIYIDEKISVFNGDEPILLSLKGDGNTNSACAKLFKKRIVESICFEEGKNVNEDGFFVFLCYLQKPKLVQHNVPVYLYNYRENSNSRQIFSEKYLSMLYFCNKKKELISSEYPQYIEQAYNMEVRTHLQFLEVLCRTNDKKYKDLCRESIKTVRRLYKYHRPFNKHHKELAWIVAHGMYPLYKKLIYLKYYK